MATIGRPITKSNFSGGWAQTWSDSHGTKDQKRYVYICAPVWYIVGSTTYAILGGSGVFQLYVSYWNGTGWSGEWHWECSGINGSQTRRFGHNRDEGNLSDSIHNNYPLYRIRYWPSRANSRWTLTLYAGGWGVSDRNYPTGQLIRSIGRTGGMEINIHADGTTNNEANVRNNIFNHTKRRGSPILGVYDHELVYYPYA